MPLRLKKTCRFCSNEELKPSRAPSDRLLRMIFLRKHFCPHCFDSFLRPALPTLTTLLVWAALYCASYLAVGNPTEMATYDWPDERAPAIRQALFAPLIRLDPRVQESRLKNDWHEQPIKPDQIAEGLDGRVLR